MSYDIKFKQRAVEYQREGHTYKEKEGKLGEVKIQVRKPKKIYPEKLIKYIEKHPDAYLVEIAEEFNCSECAIRKALKKLNITRKKRQLHTKNNVRKK